MKILVVGAGAVGGYFGARLAEKGEDVTFLVRPKRKQLLEQNGLVVESVNGDLTISPNLITKEDEGKFDVVFIGTKAYHFQEAIDSVKQFVHNETIIIPMLNGISHIEKLQNEFTPEQVIGGICYIESTVTNEGMIRQTSAFNQFTFGELNGEKTERMERLEHHFSGTKANFQLTETVLRDLWQKYFFITAMSGVTTLFRQPTGPILELDEGIIVIKGLIKELFSIIKAENAPIPDDEEERQFKRFLKLEYEMKASMLRDMEKGEAVEVEHLQGYLLEKAKQHQIPTPYLSSIYTNLKLYEKTRL